MTQHVNHRASDEIARLRAERDALRAEVAQWKALYEHAIATRVYYTEECNKARARADALERNLASAVEALKPFAEVAYSANTFNRAVLSDEHFRCARTTLVELEKTDD